MAIKMICSDIDGTLLQYGRKKLEGEIFDQIHALHDRGILFCPASGRQYTSLGLLFEPVADCCVFLCENGGVLFKDEQCIAENPMPRALAEEIAHDLWERSDGQGEVMLSGQNCAYLMERGLGMLDRIRFIGNRYKVIADPSEIPEEIVKVSVYLHEGVAPYVDRFVPRWQQANCAVAGPYWIDTTTANKGVGVESLCSVLGFAHDEVMAFGDNSAVGKSAVGKRENTVKSAVIGAVGGAVLSLVSFVVTVITKSAAESASVLAGAVILSGLALTELVMKPKLKLSSYNNADLLFVLFSAALASLLMLTEFGARLCSGSAAGICALLSLVPAAVLTAVCFIIKAVRKHKNN